MDSAPIKVVLDERSAVRRTLWVSTFEGCLTQVFLNWSSGSILTGFLLYLGAGPVALAALAGIPLLAQLFNPLVAWLAVRVPSRRVFIMITGLIGRGLWLFPILLPLLGLSQRDALFWMLAAISVSSIFQNSAGLAWIGLIADVVPPDIRGRYFGMRSAIIGVVGMAAGLVAGRYLDRTPAPGSFQMVFVVALLFAVAGLCLFRWYYEPPAAHQRLQLRDSIVLPLRDPNFRKFLAFSMYWQGSVMIAAPFVIPYFLQHLHMSFTQIAIWSAIASSAALITSPLWGRIGDRAGHKTVLSITTILAGTVHPMCWMIATPGHLFFIWLSGIMDAVSWGGVNPAVFNLSIGTAPPSARMAYLALLNFASGFVGFAVCLLSGPLLHFLLQHDFVVGGFHWTGYHSLFLLSGLLRSQAWRLVARVEEPQAWATRDLLRAFGARSLDFVNRVWPRAAE